MAGKGFGYRPFQTGLVPTEIHPHPTESEVGIANFPQATDFIHSPID